MHAPWGFQHHQETHVEHNCSNNTWAFSERQSLLPPQLEAESSVTLSRTPANPQAHSIYSSPTTCSARTWKMGSLKPSLRKQTFYFCLDYLRNSSSCFHCSHHFCSSIRLRWENEAHWFNNWQGCWICRKYWWLASLCKCSDFDFL